MRIEGDSPFKATNLIYVTNLCRFTTIKCIQFKRVQPPFTQPIYLYVVILKSVELKIKVVSFPNTFFSVKFVLFSRFIILFIYIYVINVHTLSRIEEKNGNRDERHHMPNVKASLIVVK